ncbi:MAG: O-antigen ligase family protein [Pseudomonadota bacterium]
MNISFVTLLILIVWLPLPYGSNHAWAWAVMEVWIFSLALFWLWQYLRGETQFTPVFYKAIPILVIWLVWLIYVIFQIIPLPYFLVELLSPQAAQVYAFTNPSLITLSVDPYNTAVGLLKSLSYVLLFTLTLLIVNSRTRLLWVAYALVFSGLFQAVYATLMTSYGLEYGAFFHEKIHNRGLATGTFVNRNHLAGYLEMCLSVGIGLLIAQLGKGTQDANLRERVVGVLAWVLSPKMLLRLSLVFMVIALVMTRSRMGNTAFFASMMIAGAIALSLSRHANRATVILLVSLIVIDIFIVGSWFGLQKVKERLVETNMTAEARDEVNVDILPYWQDYFLTGSGLGSFYTTFPRYQSPDVEGYYDHAHNDYLEVATETGIIGLLLLGIAVLLTIAVVLDTQYRRHSPLNRGIAFAATMAIIALLIHSTVDFNLQIPANGATFMLILALAWVARYLPRKRTHDSPFRLGKNVTLGLMAVLIYLIYVAGSWGFAEFTGVQVRKYLAKWQNQGVEQSEWNMIREASTDVLQFAPNSPDLMITMGHVYFWQPSDSVLESQGSALDYFLKAVERRPTSSSLWGHITQFKHYLQQYDADFMAAFENAAVFGLGDPFAQHIIAEVGLATWYHLSSDAQSHLIATIERFMQKEPDNTLQLIKMYRREWVVCGDSTGQQAELVEFCQQLLSRR